MVHIHDGILLGLLKKEGNSAVCDNTGETGGQHAKQDESDTERQTLCDLTSMWDLKKPSS